MYHLRYHDGTLGNLTIFAYVFSSFATTVARELGDGHLRLSNGQGCWCSEELGVSSKATWWRR